MKRHYLTTSTIDVEGRHEMTLFEDPGRSILNQPRCIHKTPSNVGAIITLTSFIMCHHDRKLILALVSLYGTG